MTAPLSCEVRVDGQRLADTAAEFLASVPTVLTGLTMSWGRSGVMDQPDASTVSFTVRDKESDADFLGLLHVGRPVEVWAAGRFSTGGLPGDVAVDGDLASPAAQRVRATNGAAANSTEGGTSIRFTPTAASRPGSLLVPPAPMSSDPQAWDMIPTPAPGDRWTVRVRVRSIALAASLWLVQIDRGSGEGVTTRASVPVPVGADWQTIEVGWSPTAAVTFGWVGARVDTEAATSWADWPGAWDEQVVTWRDLGSIYVESIAVMAPERAERRVLMFAGRITDLVAQSPRRGLSVSVTAVDYSADLANDYVGDNPWPVQTVAARAAIVNGLATHHTTLDIDRRPGAYSVSWRDVDSQPVLTLLRELAQSGDAVLWAAEHATLGTFLWFEDTSARLALGVLFWNGTLVEIGGNPRPSQGIVLSACDIDRDPVRWQSSVGDVVTRVNLTWLEQTLGEDGLPATIEHVETVIDRDAESVDGANLGVRSLSYATQLVNAADARRIALRILARSRGSGWRVSGLSWDTDLTGRSMNEPDRHAALDLLDGTRRNGLPVTVTDNPPWTPVGEIVNAYVEGGTWTYDDARWLFDMNISPAGATGRSVRWQELDPAWSWNEFDPAITWWSLRGVAAAVDSPPWSAINHPWALDLNTWQDYLGPQGRKAA
jgi:hypothetical protein